MKISRSFIRYLVVGGSAFLTEYALYLLLHKHVGMHQVSASVIVYSLLFWFVFLLNRRWSFQSKQQMAPQLLKYAALFIFNNLVGNVLLLSLLTDVVGLSTVLAPIVKMACIVLWNYFIYKYFIYV